MGHGDPGKADAEYHGLQDGEIVQRQSVQRMVNVEQQLLRGYRIASESQGGKTAASGISRYRKMLLPVLMLE